MEHISNKIRKYALEDIDRAIAISIWRYKDGTIEIIKDTLDGNTYFLSIYLEDNKYIIRRSLYVLEEAKFIGDRKDIENALSKLEQELYNIASRKALDIIKVIGEEFFNQGYYDIQNEQNIVGIVNKLTNKYSVILKFVSEDNKELLSTKEYVVDYSELLLRLEIHESLDIKESYKGVYREDALALSKYIIEIVEALGQKDLKKAINYTVKAKSLLGAYIKDPEIANDIFRTLLNSFIYIITKNLALQDGNGKV